MSLLSALNTGATGIAANSTDLDVIGDNIANANTVGFKESRVNFNDAMAASLIGSGTATVTQAGQGVQLQSVQKLMTQGSISNTGVATDLALNGSGMFVVSGTHDGRDGMFFTRAGQFTMDRNGYLVNVDGLRVQGYMATPDGVVGSIPGDLMVGNASSQPVPTTDILVHANLDSNAVVKSWDPADPAGTSNFSTSVGVYDSLGNMHQVDLYFSRTPTGWAWNAMTDGGGLAGGVAGVSTPIASGELSFDTQGRLASVNTIDNNFQPVGAISPQPITWSFGDDTASGGTGLQGVTQFAGPSATTVIYQNGFGSGSLTRITVDTEGKINGVFSNGQSRVLGQVAVANFLAPDQLERVGGNLLSATPTSGQATLGKPGAGGRGGIVAGALEQSNVDLAEEFVRMIAAQRGFQANSKTLTTADQLLGELMTIKR